MDNTTPVYVLVTDSLDTKGGIQRSIVRVTFDIHEAEAHKGASYENEFVTSTCDANWQEAAATSDLVSAMRGFRGMVEEMQAEALR